MPPTPKGFKVVTAVGAGVATNLMLWEAWASNDDGE